MQIIVRAAKRRISTLNSALRDELAGICGVGACRGGFFVYLERVSELNVERGEG